MASCGVNNNKEEKKINAYPVVNVQQKDVELDQLYVSDIKAVQYVELRSRVSGYLDKILVDEGAFVKKGTLLFHISDEEFAAEISREKANLSGLLAELKTSELELERVKTLVEKKIVSPGELKIAKAKLQLMQAKVDEARSLLEHKTTRKAYCNIVAPFDGVVNRIPMKKGAFIEEGTLLTSISDVSSVYAYFNVSENEYLHQVRNRTHLLSDTTHEVHLVLADGREYIHPGYVETVVAEFESTTGTIAYRAKFPNPDKLLKHGATGKVRVTSELREALVVPQKAAFEIQDKHYVYVVGKDSVVHMRSFTPSAREHDNYVVATGLQPTEQIVYEGIQNITEGTKITPFPFSKNHPAVTAIK